MKQRGRGTEQHMTSVREFGPGPDAGNGDSDKGYRINQPPMFNKAYMCVAVRKCQQKFAQIRDDAIAEGSDADGPEIADEDSCPEASFGVQTIHACGGHGAEQDM